MYPNQLIELRQLHNPTVLFCGAGLSIGSVPGAINLYKNSHRQVEQFLGLEGLIDHGEFASVREEVRLYVWADRILEELKRREVPLPKLRFADALGLLDNPLWWGKAEIDFRGNTPRHRVIARFAKEGLWQSVWSFNWDCILENALEQIGLPESTPRFESPWEKSHYKTHVHSQYFSRSNDRKALNIYKPHGCVRALREAKAAEGADLAKANALSYRLMVGSQELLDRSSISAAKEEDKLFFAILGSDVSGRLNLAVGWSMSEGSLKVELARFVGISGTMLVVVDPNFSIGHAEICRAAGLRQADTHVQLELEDCLNRDDFFLWQQAMYTLDRLEAQNEDAAVLDRDGKDWRSTDSPCEQERFFWDWADEFLPAWTRLCWSTGLIRAPLMPSHRIDLEQRDEHIPLGYSHVPRPDLLAAIRILRAIPALGRGFDPKTFPGGLFHEKTGTLVIPLPCAPELNDLRGLRPLVDSLRHNLSYVSRLAIWPIPVNADCIDRGEVLRHRLASIMPIPAFADPENIGVIGDLSEVAP